MTGRHEDIYNKAVNMADCVAAFRPTFPIFHLISSKFVLNKNTGPSAGLLFCPTKFNNGTRLLIAAQLPRR